MKKSGIFVIILGLALTIFTTITLFAKEKVVDIGDVKITKNKPLRLGWSPITGLAVMGFGGAMLWMSPKINKQNS